jgi:hypothetical protein
MPAGSFHIKDKVLIAVHMAWVTEKWLAQTNEERQDMVRLKSFCAFVLLLLPLIPGCIAGFESHPEYQPTLPDAKLKGPAFIKCEEHFTVDGREPWVKYHDTYTEEYLRQVLSPAPFTKNPNDARFIFNVNLRQNAHNNILNYIVSGASLGIIPLYAGHRYDLDVNIRDRTLNKNFDFHAEAEAFAWEGLLLIPAYPFANFKRVDKTITEKLVAQLLTDMEGAGVFAPPPVLDSEPIESPPIVSQPAPSTTKASASETPAKKKPSVQSAFGSLHQ